MDSPPNTTTMSPHPRCIPHIPPAVSPTAPPACPHPRSLVQHAAPDDPQVLEDTQVLPAGRPSGNVEEAWGELSVTHAPTLWMKTLLPPPPQIPPRSPVSSSRLSKIRSSLGSRGGVLVLGSLPGTGMGGRVRVGGLVTSHGLGGQRGSYAEALTHRRSRAGRPGCRRSWCSRRSAGCWRRSRRGHP